MLPDIYHPLIHQYPSTSSFLLHLNCSFLMPQIISFYLFLTSEFENWIKSESILLDRNILRLTSLIIYKEYSHDFIMKSPHFLKMKQTLLTMQSFFATLILFLLFSHTLFMSFFCEFVTNKILFYYEWFFIVNG